MTHQLSIPQPTTQAMPQATTQATPQAAALIKLVMFPIGQLLLATPMDRISRVIRPPQIYSSGLGSVGVTTVGDRELTIIDLHRELFHTPSPQLTEGPGYLVLAPTPSGELIGIPIAQAPLLIEVPASLVRQLPESYRQADTLWIASHMARVALEGDPAIQSIFVLDMAAVIQRMTQKGSKR